MSVRRVFCHYQKKDAASSTNSFVVACGRPVSATRDGRSPREPRDGGRVVAASVEATTRTAMEAHEWRRGEREWGGVPRSQRRRDEHAREAQPRGACGSAGGWIWDGAECEWGDDGDVRMWARRSGERHKLKRACNSCWTCLWHPNSRDHPLQNNTTIAKAKTKTKAREAKANKSKSKMNNKLKRACNSCWACLWHPDSRDHPLQNNTTTRAKTKNKNKNKSKRNKSKQK